MIIYYQPSESIVDFLNKELHSLRSNTQQPNAEGEPIIYKRTKEGRNKIAKAKHDAIDRIFQSLADIVYFLEFIEDHEELHEFYEKDLKDLFGINEEPEVVIEDEELARRENPEITTQDPKTKKYYYKKRKYHYLNRGGPFSRLLAAVLFYHTPRRPKLDFRMQLINTVLNYAIFAMQRRIEDTDKESLLTSDATRVLVWSNILSRELHNKNVKNDQARRGFGFHPWRL